MGIVLSLPSEPSSSLCMYQGCDGSSISLLRAQPFVRYDHVGRGVTEDEVGGGRWRVWGRREIYIQDFGGGKPECILKNLGGKAWTWLFVIGHGEMTGCCEYGNERSGSVKCG
jgi:hypothetical protein